LISYKDFKNILENIRDDKYEPKCDENNETTGMEQKEVNVNLPHNPLSK